MVRVSGLNYFFGSNIGCIFDAGATAKGRLNLTPKSLSGHRHGYATNTVRPHHRFGAARERLRE